MPVIKKSSKWGSMVVIGNGRATQLPSGEIVSVRGEEGKRRCVFYLITDLQKTKAGFWRRQCIYCKIFENNPMFQLAVNLQENDIVEIQGVLEEIPYTHQMTNTRKIWREIRIYTLTVRGNTADGSLYEVADTSRRRNKRAADDGSNFVPSATPDEMDEFDDDELYPF